MYDPREAHLTLKVFENPKGETTLIAAATAGAVKSGLHCGRFVKDVAQYFGGSGGGMPDLAKGSTPHSIGVIAAEIAAGIKRSGGSFALPYLNELDSPLQPTDKLIRQIQEQVQILLECTDKGLVSVTRLKIETLLMVYSSKVLLKPDSVS